MPAPNSVPSNPQRSVAALVGAARVSLALGSVAAIAGGCAAAAAAGQLPAEGGLYRALPFLCLSAIFAAPIAGWVWVAGAGLNRRLQQEQPDSELTRRTVSARRLALLAVPLAGIGGWGLLQLYADSGWTGFGRAPAGFGIEASPSGQHP